MKSKIKTGLKKMTRISINSYLQTCSGLCNEPNEWLSYPTQDVLGDTLTPPIYCCTAVIIRFCTHVTKQNKCTDTLLGTRSSDRR